MDSRKLSSDIVDRFRKSLGEGDRVMVKPMTRKHDGRWRVLLFAIDGEQWVVGDRTPVNQFVCTMCPYSYGCFTEGVEHVANDDDDEPQQQQ